MFARLVELLLGLPRTFMGGEGDLSVRFNPIWPWQETVGAAVWNLLLVGGLGYLIYWVYRREGRGPRVRIVLGILRGLLAALVLMLLNRPVITLTQNRVEPSIVAVLVDDSLSMRVKDMGTVPGKPESRLDAVRDVLIAKGGVLEGLAKEHTIRLYRFDRDADLLGTVGKGGKEGITIPESLGKLEPMGQSTAVGGSIVKVVSDLAGQRLAGIVVLTDGRDTPARPLAEALAKVRDVGAGTKIFTVEVGGEQAPRNLAIQNMVVQDAAFKGDIVGVRVTIRGTGYPAGSKATVKLLGPGGRPLPGVAGPAEASVTLDGENPIDVEIPMKPEDVGELQMTAVVSAVNGGGDAGGEVDDADNSRIARIAVLDAKVNLLYVEGYPRWDYRFVRTEMMRDKTVDVSILLTSADAGFAQDGDKPIRRFPESMDELLPYDVVVIGDVDPRQFTDAQLQLLSDFVGKKGGGFAMVAGPRFAPARYRNTPIEALLPVSIGAVAQSPQETDLTTGFRPVVTPAGAASGIFRFIPDKVANENYLKNDWQMVFWHLRGIAVKPGAGEVLAEHPTDIGPDGKKAPILVAGRYGSGRTIFSAIDDSWRWRYYTGETVFDTYWVQQIRLLARSRKLGQRLYTLSSSRTTYELGESVTLTLRILETSLLRQLPDRIDVDITGDDGQLQRHEALVKQDDRPDTYVATFTADRVGRANAKVAYVAPGAGGGGGGSGEASVPIETIVPRLELADPRVDRVALQRYAVETSGTALKLAEASEKLPPLIASAAKIIPLESSKPLWDAPIVMALFVLLITGEWIVRKLFGMV